MNFFENYIQIQNISSNGLGDAIKGSIIEFSQKYLETFDYKTRKLGLLHGQVQSGKTAQALGIIAKAADEGFKLFIYLTTDNISLQQQTLDRAQRSLPTFNVYGEMDELSFLQNGFSKPVILILKKNPRVLSTWLTNIQRTDIAKKRAIMIVDDEADNASLNTKINQQEQSRIYQLLEQLFTISPSGFYLQVTATPQALLLQTNNSIQKPSFAYAYKPGKKYLGGDDFYIKGEQIQKVVDDKDVSLLLDTDSLPESLKKAILAYLIITIQLDHENKKSCNMLIHPSHKVKVHGKVKTKIQTLLSSLIIDYLANSPAIRDEIFYAWNDIKETYPSIIPFQVAYEKFGSIITNVKVLVLNSISEKSGDINNGYNILIGGNVLGRGITISSLQVVYYTRESKTPLADTITQHQRIFGYDRIFSLSRIFATQKLLKIFRELSEANQVIFNGVDHGNLENIPILLPEKIKPTRMNVVETNSLELIVGDVNYFPLEPLDTNTTTLDKILGISDSTKPISLDEAVDIVSHQRVNDFIDWNKDVYQAAIIALKERQPQVSCLLIVRTGRKIKKGTGTLLSPNDRALGEANNDKLVLTMYRLTGEASLGWNNKPLWVPNIKFPKDKVFWRTA
jgi:hypothetical protein